MPKMYHTQQLETLLNPSKLVDWLKAAINGEEKLYWETENIPKQRYSEKLVGEDFDKRILET